MTRDARRRILITLIVVVVVAGLSTGTTWGCPNCKDALSQHDPSGGGLVQGFFWSILWMLSMPVLILTGLATYFYVLVRRARRNSAVVPAPLVANALPTWEQVMARELAQSRGSIN